MKKLVILKIFIAILVISSFVLSVLRSVEVIDGGMVLGIPNPYKDYEIKKSYEGYGGLIFAYLGLCELLTLFGTLKVYKVFNIFMEIAKMILPWSLLEARVSIINAVSHMKSSYTIIEPFPYIALVLCIISIILNIVLLFMKEERKKDKWEKGVSMIYCIMISAPVFLYIAIVIFENVLSYIMI